MWEGRSREAPPYPDQSAIIGYARVSTDGQTLDAQHAKLREAGAEKVFAKKMSGAVTTGRPWRRQSMRSALAMCCL